MALVQLVHIYLLEEDIRYCIDIFDKPFLFHTNWTIYVKQDLRSFHFLVEVWDDFVFLQRENKPHAHNSQVFLRAKTNMTGLYLRSDFVRELLFTATEDLLADSTETTWHPQVLRARLAQHFHFVEVSF